MIGQSIADLAQAIREAVAASGLTGRDTGRAIAAVLYEQPCGAEGYFGHLGQLEHYVCVKLWHEGGRCDWELASKVPGTCPAIIPALGYIGGWRRCCHELVDGKCPLHPDPKNGASDGAAHQGHRLPGSRSA